MLKTNYLQTSYIKKYLDYVEFQEVVLRKTICRKNWKNKRSFV